MTRALFLIYIAGLAGALVLAGLGDNLWVIGIAIGLYAFTHLMLREIDRKEKTK